MEQIQKVIDEQFICSIKKEGDDYIQIIKYNPTNIIDAIKTSIEFSCDKLSYLLEYSKLKYSNENKHLLGELFKTAINCNNMDALIILLSFKLYPRDHLIENKIIWFIYDKNRIDLIPFSIKNGISNKRFFSLLYRHPIQSKKSKDFFLQILSTINTTNKSNEEFIRQDMDYMIKEFQKLICYKKN